MRYKYLSSRKKKCYNRILREASAFRTSFSLEPTVSPKCVPKLIRLVVHDNPQLFWLTGGSSVKWSSVGDKVQKITCTLKVYDGFSASHLCSMNERLNRKLDAVAAAARRKTSVFEQVLYVHDYIVDSTTYDKAAPHRYSAYGCLVGQRAVCAGYAKAFQLIMTRLGYECGYVTGSVRDRGLRRAIHAWNYIRLKRRYYFVDVTWDDPQMPLRSGAPKPKHYFCVTTREIMRTHWIHYRFFVPLCIAKKFNYYRYTGCCLDRYSFSGFSDLARKQLAKGKIITVKFPSRSERRKAVRELIKEDKIFQVPGISGKISYTADKRNTTLIIYCQ